MKVKLQQAVFEQIPDCPSTMLSINITVFLHLSQWADASDVVVMDNRRNSF